ncbi:MAG: SsrA-binding protein SmpB [Patescibacteria group bacterium]
MATFIKNKKAGLKYEILEKFEAGIKLFGFEVKAVKNNMGSVEGSHITVRGGETILLNTTIPPFQTANTPADYDPARNRTLLLSKKEIARLAESEAHKSLTIIPLAVYSKGNKIKVEVAVVRGKKKHDKRETLKKKTAEREMAREMKTKF